MYITDSSSETSSEWQSDWSSSDELEKNIKTYNTKRRILSKTKKKEANEPTPTSPSCDANVDSDNSDEQLEKCPICLLPFRKQQVATPSSCEHCFCLECLLEWSKNINTCPVDRQIFTVIHIRNHLGGKVMYENLFGLIYVSSLKKFNYFILYAIQESFKILYIYICFR